MGLEQGLQLINGHDLQHGHDAGSLGRVFDGQLQQVAGSVSDPDIFGQEFTSSPSIGGFPAPARLRIANALAISARSARSAK